MSRRQLRMDTKLMAEHSIRSLKLALLEMLTSVPKAHKTNLIGRVYQPGDLEHHLKVTFEPLDRQLADRAFEQLKADGEIRSTYDDISDPESWVQITDSGRKALKRRCLDELDLVLAQIQPTLIELREGAWSAVASNRPDSLRQASHSARELIDQTLKEGAPDERVKQMAGFVPDPSSKSGITRRHRLRYLMKLYRGSESDSELRVAEAACDLVIAADDRLQALAHSRGAPSAQEVQDSLQAAEIALRRVLAGGNAAV